jgi:hypothetical protein
MATLILLYPLRFIQAKQIQRVELIGSVELVVLAEESIDFVENTKKEIREEPVLRYSKAREVGVLDEG